MTTDIFFTWIALSCLLTFGDSQAGDPKMYKLYPSEADKLSDHGGVTVARFLQEFEKLHKRRAQMGDLVTALGPCYALAE
jgi:hypothetical protein